MSSDKRICRNCRFFRKDKNHEKLGDCFVLPPSEQQNDISAVYVYETCRYFEWAKKPEDAFCKTCRWWSNDAEGGSYGVCMKHVVDERYESNHGRVMLNNPVTECVAWCFQYDPQETPEKEEESE